MWPKAARDASTGPSLVDLLLSSSLLGGSKSNASLQSSKMSTKHNGRNHATIFLVRIAAVTYHCSYKQYQDYFTSSDPHHDTSIRQGSRHELKHYFGILSGISCDIHSGILSRISADILFGISSGIISGISSVISSDILSGISFDILSGIF